MLCFKPFMTRTSFFEEMLFLFAFFIIEYFLFKIIIISLRGLAECNVKRSLHKLTGQQKSLQP